MIKLPAIVAPGTPPVAAVLLALSLFVLTPVARASEPPMALAPGDLGGAGEAPLALVLDAAIGPGQLGGVGEAALALDAMLRLRASPWELGVVAGGWGDPFGTRLNAYYGVVAGCSQPVSRAVRLEILGEAGIDEAEAGTGLSFFPDPSAARGAVALPYLGLRTGVHLGVGGRVRFLLGGWGAVRADLRHGRVVASGRDLGEVGGVAVGFQLRLGLEVGLGGRSADVAKRSLNGSS